MPQPANHINSFCVKNTMNFSVDWSLHFSIKADNWLNDMRQQYRNARFENEKKSDDNIAIRM